MPSFNPWHRQSHEVLSFTSRVDAIDSYVSTFVDHTVNQRVWRVVWALVGECGQVIRRDPVFGLPGLELPEDWYD